VIKKKEKGRGKGKRRWKRSDGKEQEGRRELDNDDESALIVSLNEIKREIFKFSFRGYQN
jgi:hypothetical protein